MPTTARASRTDGDAEAGAAEAEKCKKVRVTLPVLSVLQTVLQHAAEALADKTKELTDVLGSINNDQLVAEPDVWLQHHPHSARCAGQQMAPEQRRKRRMGGSRHAGVASWDIPTGLMIGRHHSSCVGEHCAYSRVSYMCMM